DGGLGEQLGDELDALAADSGHADRALHRDVPALPRGPAGRQTVDSGAGELLRSGMSDGDATDHLAHNRAVWSSRAPDYLEPGRRGWTSSQLTWGIWAVPESTLGVLPDVTGADVIELGCGTAYLSAKLARAGA